MNNAFRAVFIRPTAGNFEMWLPERLQEIVLTEVHPEDRVSRATVDQRTRYVAVTYTLFVLRTNMEDYNIYVRTGSADV